MHSIVCSQSAIMCDAITFFTAAIDFGFIQEIVKFLPAWERFMLALSLGLDCKKVYAPALICNVDKRSYLTPSYAGVFGADSIHDITITSFTHVIIDFSKNIQHSKYFCEIYKLAFPEDFIHVGGAGCLRIMETPCDNSDAPLNSVLAHQRQSHEPYDVLAHPEKYGTYEAAMLIWRFGILSKDPSDLYEKTNYIGSSLQIIATLVHGDITNIMCYESFDLNLYYVLKNIDSKHFRDKSSNIRINLFKVLYHREKNARRMKVNNSYSLFDSDIEAIISWVRDAVQPKRITFDVNFHGCANDIVRLINAGLLKFIPVQIVVIKDFLKINVDEIVNSCQRDNVKISAVYMPYRGYRDNVFQEQLHLEYAQLRDDSCRYKHVELLLAHTTATLFDIASLLNQTPGEFRIMVKLAQKHRPGCNTEEIYSLHEYARIWVGKTSGYTRYPPKISDLMKECIRCRNYDYLLWLFSIYRASPRIITTAQLSNVFAMAVISENMRFIKIFVDENVKLLEPAREKITRECMNEQLVEAFGIFIP